VPKFDDSPLPSIIKERRERRKAKKSKKNMADTTGLASALLIFSVMVIFAGIKALAMAYGMGACMRRGREVHRRRSKAWHPRLSNSADDSMATWARLVNTGGRSWKLCVGQDAISDVFTSTESGELDWHSTVTPLGSVFADGNCKEDWCTTFRISGMEYHTRFGYINYDITDAPVRIDPLGPPVAWLCFRTNNDVELMRTDPSTTRLRDMALMAVAIMIEAGTVPDV
jgi:hypothetical protein